MNYILLHPHCRMGPFYASEWTSQATVRVCISMVPRFLNEISPQPIVSPVIPTPHEHDEDELDCPWLANFHQFLSACNKYDIPEDDIFDPRDLILDINGLARVAATILVISRGEKKRSRSWPDIHTDTNSGLLFTQSQEEPLRLREYDYSSSSFMAPIRLSSDTI